MKTVITQNIDGYEIVTAFGEATVDGVATWSAIQDKVIALDELTQVNALKTKIQAQVDIAANMAQLAENATKSGLLVQAESYAAQQKSALSQADALGVDMPTLVEAFEAKRKELFEANAVYHILPSGESQITDAQYETMKTAFDNLTDNGQLLLAGGEVADYRGKSYWIKKSEKWESATISTLGVPIPSGGILTANLTSDEQLEIATQAEADRVSSLSDADKLAEALAAQSSVKKSTVQDYQEALISGEDATKALASSQEAYKTSLVAINAKYGTSLS